MAEEVSPEVIAETQKVLGKYVSKPPLTDKLLKKPPFRFLHDVVNAVVKETEFLKGLFKESELQSDNVKDRDGKIAFLNKLITAVKTISGIELQVRASKIIAGLEPIETNKLLQAIGTSIEKKLDSKEYVNQLKGKGKAKIKDEKTKISSKTSVKSNKSNDSGTNKISPNTPKTKTSKSGNTPIKKTVSKTDVKSKGSVDSTKPEKKTVKVKESPRKIETKTSKASPRATDQLKNVTVVKDKEIPSAESTPRNKEKIIETEVKEVINPPENQIPEAEPQEVPEAEPSSAVVIEEKKPIERPKSARPRSGELKIKDEVVLADIKSVPEIKPEVKKEPEKKISEPILRPKSSIRPPSVRPSSARPGAPRLRPESALPLKELIPMGKINVIIENFGDKDDKEEDEEETVVIQNIPDEIPDPIILEKSLDIPADKGHLVEQILEEIQGPEQLEEHVKGGIQWDQENSRGRDAIAKEINQLRASIQALTRTANPLGKLMSYLHEDVEAMHSELDTWTKMKRHFVTEIAKQKRVNKDSNQPLLNQLRELEENITKQREEIATVRFNVLRNEERISYLVGKQVVTQ